MRLAGGAEPPQAFVPFRFGLKYHFSSIQQLNQARYYDEKRLYIYVTLYTKQLCHRDALKKKEEENKSAHSVILLSGIQVLVGEEVVGVFDEEALEPLFKLEVK